MDADIHFIDNKPPTPVLDWSYITSHVGIYTPLDFEQVRIITLSDSEEKKPYSMLYISNGSIEPCHRDEWRDHKYKNSFEKLTISFRAI